ncbi:hypothetical protein E2C01_025244 [Portunus trituberculatus]|uniref:Uncharacterized protein n=1 Tax=Portunus trituberculatus TaxID=210409 RepID=A0A5B7EHC5_PORTR|nr:hypothetical protein [Portunus trituberculatus]
MVAAAAAAAGHPKLTSLHPLIPPLHSSEELHPHQLLHLRNTEVQVETLMPPLHLRTTTLSILAEARIDKHSNICTGSIYNEMTASSTHKQEYIFGLKHAATGLSLWLAKVYIWSTGNFCYMSTDWLAGPDSHFFFPPRGLISSEMFHKASSLRFRESLSVCPEGRGRVDELTVFLEAIGDVLLPLKPPDWSRVKG